MVRSAFVEYYYSYTSLFSFVQVGKHDFAIEIIIRIIHMGTSSHSGWFCNENLECDHTVEHGFVTKTYDVIIQFSMVLQ